jgi:hypothetical protein
VITQLCFAAIISPGYDIRLPRQTGPVPVV